MKPNKDTVCDGFFTYCKRCEKPLQLCNCKRIADKKLIAEVFGCKSCEEKEAEIASLKEQIKRLEGAMPFLKELERANDVLRAGNKNKKED